MSKRSKAEILVDILKTNPKHFEEFISEVNKLKENNPQNYHVMLYSFLQLDFNSLVDQLEEKNVITLLKLKFKHHDNTEKTLAALLFTNDSKCITYLIQKISPQALLMILQIQDEIEDHNQSYLLAAYKFFQYGLVDYVPLINKLDPAALENIFQLKLHSTYPFIFKFLEKNNIAFKKLINKLNSNTVFRTLDYLKDSKFAVCDDSENKPYQKYERGFSSYLFYPQSFQLFENPEKNLQKQPIEFNKFLNTIVRDFNDTSLFLIENLHKVLKIVSKKHKNYSLTLHLLSLFGEKIANNLTIESLQEPFISPICQFFLDLDQCASGKTARFSFRKKLHRILFGAPLLTQTSPFYGLCFGESLIQESGGSSYMTHEPVQLHQSPLVVNCHRTRLRALQYLAKAAKDSRNNDDYNEIFESAYTRFRDNLLINEELNLSNYFEDDNQNSVSFKNWLETFDSSMNRNLNMLVAETDYDRALALLENRAILLEKSKEWSAFSHALISYLTQRKAGKVFEKEMLTFKFQYEIAVGSKKITQAKQILSNMQQCLNEEIKQYPHQELSSLSGLLLQINPEKEEKESKFLISLEPLNSETRPVFDYPLESLNLDFDIEGDIVTFYPELNENLVHPFFEFLETNNAVNSIKLVFFTKLFETNFSDRLIKVIREKNFSMLSINYEIWNNDDKNNSRHPELKALLLRNNYYNRTNSFAKNELNTLYPNNISQMICHYHGGSFFTTTTTPPNFIIAALESYHRKHVEKPLFLYNKGFIALIEEISKQNSDNPQLLLEVIHYLRQNNDIVKKLDSGSKDYIQALQILMDHLVKFAPVNTLFDVKIENSMVFMTVKPGFGAKTIIESAAKQLMKYGYSLYDYSFWNQTGTVCKNIQDAIQSKSGRLFLKTDPDSYRRLCKVYSLDSLSFQR